MRVEGLETLDYLDNLQERKRLTEQGDAITFEGEVNILLFLSYCFTGNCCTITKNPNTKTKKKVASFSFHFLNDKLKILILW